MNNTKLRIVILVCILVLGSLAHANVPMGSAGVEDVIYAHSSGGYGAIYWQQYDATGANIGTQFICNSPGQDIGIINSITARANSNGNVDMIYLMTNTGWSDVRLQQLDTSGNLVGAMQFLESDSVDGFRKFYTGVDAGKLANGDRVLALSGVDIQGNSTIYLSKYVGNVRQSQSVLKSFAGDIGIGDVVFSDIDGDGSVELLYATSTGGIATVGRIDFDTAGNIVSETPNYLQADLSWGANFTCKALSIGQADGDAGKELLVAMSRPDQGMETYTLAYQLTTPVVYPTTAFSAETSGTGLGSFMWQGVGIVDFSGETVAISAPASKVVDVIYTHSNGGYGAIYWRQYNAATAMETKDQLLYASSSGADIAYIDSLTVKDWDGNGNIDMIYLYTSIGWSVVNMQELDENMNRVGDVLLLESHASDGFNKQYKGVDAGMFKIDGYPRKALVLSGLDAQGNSTIYLSIYDGNVRQSQSVLKSFTGDIGIGDVAFSDIDDDSNVELLYVTTTGGKATVSRIDFDSAGGIASEDPNYIDGGVIDFSSWAPTATCKALSIGQADDDAGKELLVAMSRPEQAMETITLAYDLDASPEIWATNGVAFAFAMDADGSHFMWRGIAIVDFTEDLTVPEPTTCGEVLAYGYGNKADIYPDCKIDLADVGVLASQWLNCTFVDDFNCVQVSLPPVYQVPSGIVAVDGDLSDWADANWIVMDKTYYISDVNGANTIDVSNAKWSAKWNPVTNLIYVAVVVEDSNHYFMPGQYGWDGQDAVEFYINADVSTVLPYSPYDPTAAQEYVVASADGSEAEWAVYGDGVEMPSDMLPAYEVSVDGNTISYEIAMVPYKEVDPYLGVPNVVATVMDLTENMTIGLDVVANTKWNSGGVDYFAQLCENTNGVKSLQSYAFIQFKLVDPACGAWGRFKEDINSDCQVDMLDFAELAGLWFYCNDPADSNCVQTW